MAPASIHGRGKSSRKTPKQKQQAAARREHHDKYPRTNENDLTDTRNTTDVQPVRTSNKKRSGESLIARIIREK